jgi:hypothetical protein
MRPCVATSIRQESAASSTGAAHPAEQAAVESIERWREQQAERGHAQHGEEHGRTEDCRIAASRRQHRSLL